MSTSRGLARALVQGPSVLTEAEIRGIGERVRRVVGWLGPYQDPREYAVELGLKVSMQSIPGSSTGMELTGDIILYRWDPDTRVWGARVYGGITRWALRGAIGELTFTDRMRVAGEIASFGLLPVEPVERVIRAQAYCPAWALRAYDAYLRKLPSVTRGAA